MRELANIVAYQYPTIMTFSTRILCRGQQANFIPLVFLTARTFLTVPFVVICAPTPILLHGEKARHSPSILHSLGIQVRRRPATVLHTL